MASLTGNIREPIYFTEQIRANPQDAYAHDSGGVSWLLKGELDNAIKDLTEAIRLGPQDVGIYFARGSAWEAKGEWDNAIKDYTEAIRLNPQHAMIYNNFAWLKATCPDAQCRDGKKAVELAMKGCELSGWKNPN